MSQHANTFIVKTVDANAILILIGSDATTTSCVYV